MAGFFARGTMKPPLGARVNPGHPLSAGLLACIPFNEGAALFNATTSLSVLAGTAIAGTLPPPTTVLPVSTAQAFSSNRDGRCLNCPATNGSLTFGGTDGSWLPTTACMIVIVRRKQDTTNRSSALFGLAAGGASNRCGAHVPYDDGVVYFDYGGTSAPNRLSASGLSFSTAIPECWIFSAGPAGSAIWQNGVKVASQATAVTRVASTASLTLNGGNGAGGDALDLNYVAVYATQWSDPLCAWWSAEPYAHLYPEQARTFDVLEAGGPTVIESVGTAAGVATVAGVGGYRTGHPKSGFGAQKKARRHNR